jgi:hypothetical protein
MKPQYRGRLEEFKTTISETILNYVNTELYSDAIISDREYVYNKIFLKLDDILDYVDKFDIVQKTSLRISPNQYKFLSLISGKDDESDANNLFLFNDLQLTKAEVYDLYKDYNVIYQYDSPYYQINCNDIYLDLGIENEISTTLLYDSDNDGTSTALYKYPITSSLYRLVGSAGSNNNYILAEEGLIEEDSLNKVRSNVLYYKIESDDNLPLDINNMTSVKKIQFDLFKTSDEKYSTKDMIFTLDTFVIADEITFE